VVRQGKVKGDVYLAGTRGDTVAARVVRMERLKEQGLLVQHLPPALVNDVPSGNIVLLELFNKGSKVGEQE
jgi:hypothetical protein